MRSTSPAGEVTTSSSPARPAIRAAIGSTRNRGSGTGRRWCVFGVPNTARPLTSVTDSATSSRRFTRSTRRTRSAANSPHRKPV
ncbi:hypothetical protein AB0C15_19100 [Micromonospora sp. NPDC048835]|uniref:hypothetical protein n=1 Tax=Micromonospora sp. NPDC048835 TaxID=3155147 RepID=UPI0033CFE5FE